MQSEVLPLKELRSNRKCMRCFLESLLAMRDVNLDDPDSRKRVADGWGEIHLGWLERYLRGEIEWLPLRHLYAIEVLFDLTPVEVHTLEEMNDAHCLSQDRRGLYVLCPSCGK
jgi:hypothetical protein